jgi:hypothetical protein
MDYLVEIILEVWKRFLDAEASTTLESGSGSTSSLTAVIGRRRPDWFVGTGRSRAIKLRDLERSD